MKRFYHSYIRNQENAEILAWTQWFKIVLFISYFLMKLLKLLTLLVLSLFLGGCDVMDSHSLYGVRNKIMLGVHVGLSH